jgi:hypothetical protein
VKNDLGTSTAVKASLFPFKKILSWMVLLVILPEHLKQWLREGYQMILFSFSQPNMDSHPFGINFMYF